MTKGSQNEYRAVYESFFYITYHVVCNSLNVQCGFAIFDFSGKHILKKDFDPKTDKAIFGRPNFVIFPQHNNS